MGEFFRSVVGTAIGLFIFQKWIEPALDKLDDWFDKKGE